MPRFYNLLGAVPLIAWLGWDLWRESATFIASYPLLDVGGHIDALFAFQTVGQVAGIGYTSFIILLLIVRDVPRTRIQGLVPYAAAMVGAFATEAFFVIPTAALPIPILALSTLFIISGLGLSIYALIYLGRSFAILPSARILVTDGPYRFIRNPLYLFEEIAIIGIMMQFAQPWSIFIVAMQFVAQLVRIHYEEQALTKAFPAYATYAGKTARLIPGIY